VRLGDRWGPRTLDVDLLLYGDATIASPTLRVPHPGLGEREFVLVPLLEIAPTLTLPDGPALQDLLLTCPRRESPLIRIEDSRA
jgi:2-amino-4-hydroxy-6-hydroxymethyldihydropteridine diphosphokinase